MHLQLASVSTVWRLESPTGASLVPVDVQAAAVPLTECVLLSSDSGAVRDVAPAVFSQC